MTRTPLLPAPRAGIAIAVLMCAIAISAPYAAQADGVRIGGSVTIKSTTGDVTNRAVGDGAKASRCAGAITGGDVQIEGDVDIEHTGSAQDCTCVGSGCETVGAAASDPNSKEDGDR